MIILETHIMDFQNALNTILVSHKSGLDLIGKNHLDEDLNERLILQTFLPTRKKMNYQ